MPVTNQTISEDVLSEANFDTASFQFVRDHLYSALSCFSRRTVEGISQQWREPASLLEFVETDELSRDIYEYIDNEQLDWVASEVMAPQRSSIDQLISEHPHLAAKWHRYSEKFSQG